MFSENNKQIIGANFLAQFNFSYKKTQKKKLKKIKPKELNA